MIRDQAGIRIERDDPLQLLRDLPGGWAQSIITRPPAPTSENGPPAQSALLAVVSELARVSRPDATLLWSIEPPQPMPLRRLALAFTLASGWQLQKNELASRSGYLLFAKQSRFHWQPAPAQPPLRLRTAGARRAWCIPAQQDATRQQLERLLLAATTRVACGACGAPWTRGAVRARDGMPMRCGHRNPHGHSLVIDPFHTPTSLLSALAISHGRGYLGIQTTTLNEAQL